MNVTAAQVLWVPGFEWYELHMQASDVPVGECLDQFIYDEKKASGRLRADGTAYFAETSDGWVRFFFSTADGSGYGGHVFTLRMRDGSERKVKGPWSSRSAAMNELGFTPSVEAHCQKPGSSLTYATHITVAAAEKVLAEFCSDYRLSPEERGGVRYSIQPVRQDVPKVLCPKGGMTFPPY